jgi:hypothetical protein
MVRSCLAVSKATLYSKGLPCVFYATVICDFLMVFTDEAQKRAFPYQQVKRLWHNGFNVLGDRHPWRVTNNRSAAAAFSP